MAQPRGPLAGVKVVACSIAQAGTVPDMLMADLGAEVIKVEVPGVGDASRTATDPPGFPSIYFETNNRGVQSLTLNLKDAEGREILYKLVREADVFGQNFRPGRRRKMDLATKPSRKSIQESCMFPFRAMVLAAPMPCSQAPMRWRRRSAVSPKPMRHRASPLKPASSRWPMRRVRSWLLGASWPGYTAPRPPASGRRLTPHCWGDRFVSWGGTLLQRMWKEVNLVTGRGTHHGHRRASGHQCELQRQTWQTVCVSDGWERLEGGDDRTWLLCGDAGKGL